MIVLGAHIKVKDKRYCAGFAWIDDLILKGEDSFAAPADQTEDDQLRVRMRSRQKLARYGRSQTNAVIVERLCGELDAEPKTPECREAAAGAVGGLKESQ